MSFLAAKNTLTLVSLTGLAISLTLSSPVVAAGARTKVASYRDVSGGGSSTGGGHVRACFTARAAAKVKNNILLSTQSPQIGIDALSGITKGDIISVDLLDLVEQPGSFDTIQASLKAFLRVTPQDGALQAIKWGIIDIVDKLEGTGFSAFDSLKSDFPRYASNTANEEWTASDTGLALTRDFDPKISNKANCVFIQAVRQEVVSAHFKTLIYDERIVEMMSIPQLAALGLHEAVYNLVLNSPAARKIQNPSVLTRQLTVLILLAIAQGGPEDFEAIAENFESLGYGPFNDMVSRSSRMSRNELKKDCTFDPDFCRRLIRVTK